MKRFLILFLALFFPVFAIAAIENPYVVDEKPQVIFGDSAPVLTYFGLENYTQNYVDGHAHITFTYTHHACCFAGDPPRIYVTDTDPRATTTITVKANEVLFPLFQFTHPTDWYLYDVQFDETGYTISVKQSGETEIFNEHRTIPDLAESDWLALANNHPNVGNNQSMAFTPVPVREEPPVEERNPVIIIPGILASTLEETFHTLNNLIWPDLITLSLSPSDVFLNQLILDDSGNRPIQNSNILATQVIKQIFDQDYFNDLMTQILETDFVENTNLFLFPYDWRLDLSRTTTDLKEVIASIKLQTNKEKVDLIAHSMGGLLVKNYIKDFGSESINKVIIIGTPYNGAPKTFGILTYGDGMGVKENQVNILSSSRVKIITQNMPSVYQLLPNKEYFNSYSSYIYDLDDLDENGVRGGLDYDQTTDFMINSGRNSLLLNRANEFHQHINSIDPNDYGVETYNIVGCGIPTLGKIFILNKKTSGDIEYNISFIDGDGTVPLKSAESMSATKTYYSQGTIHATMPSAPGIGELITAIINSDNDFSLSEHINLSDSSDICGIPDGRIVSFHSPIELHVYDSTGNHVGPISTGDIESDIPRVIYEIIEDNKFAYLPNGETYNIRGLATGPGDFNIRISKISNGDIAETIYFNQIPLLSETLVSFAVGENTESTILVDKEGDGIFETEIHPTSILNPIESLDINKPVTTLNIKGKKSTDKTFISAVRIYLSAEDDNSGILKTEYSTDGGLTWHLYKRHFVINKRGTIELMYRSTDRAGNVEITQNDTITITNPGLLKKLIDY